MISGEMDNREWQQEFIGGELKLLIDLVMEGGEVQVDNQPVYALVL